MVAQGVAHSPENDEAEVPFKHTALPSLTYCFQPPAQGHRTAVPPLPLWPWFRLEEAEGARQARAPLPIALPPVRCCLHLIGQNYVTWYLSLQGRLGNVPHFMVML